MASSPARSRRHEPALCSSPEQKRLRHRIAIAAMGCRSGGDAADGASLEEIGRLNLSVEPTASCDLLRTRVSQLLKVPVESFWLVYERRLLQGAWCLGTFGVYKSGVVVHLMPRQPGIFGPELFAPNDVRTFVVEEILHRAVDAAVREATRRAEAARVARLNAAMVDVVHASLPRPPRRRQRPAQPVAEDTVTGTWTGGLESGLPWASHPWASECRGPSHSRSR